MQNEGIKLNGTDDKEFLEILQKCDEIFTNSKLFAGAIFTTESRKDKDFEFTYYKAETNEHSIELDRSIHNTIKAVTVFSFKSDIGHIRKSLNFKFESCNKNSYTSNLTLELQSNSDSIKRHASLIITNFTLPDKDSFGLENFFSAIGKNVFFKHFQAFVELFENMADNYQQEKIRLEKEKKIAFEDESKLIEKERKRITEEQRKSSEKRALQDF